MCHPAPAYATTVPHALPLAHFFLRDLPPAMAAFILASLDFCTSCVLHHIHDRVKRFQFRQVQRLFRDLATLFAPIAPARVRDSAKGFTEPNTDSDNGIDACKADSQHVNLWHRKHSNKITCQTAFVALLRANSDSRNVAPQS